MTVKQVEKKLRAIIKRAIKNGWTLQRRAFLLEESKRCCALGACSILASGKIRTVPHTATEAAMQILGLSYSKVWDIVNGFDSVPGSNPSHIVTADNYFRLGQRLAKEFIDDKSC